MMQSQAFFRRASASRTMILGRSKSTRVEPSLVHTASEYFAALRWRAATALTSSLNSEEREQLLQKLDAVPKASHQKQETEEIVQTKSIGEAVAAARAEEAKRQESKWLREQDSLVKQAEEAAKARVESDLRIQERRIALERWTRELEKEKEQDATQIRDSTDTAQEVDNVHPVLGEALVDLEYKRVHVVSAKELASIPIWKKQRIYRHSRAKVMANDKVKTAELGLPGIIALHEDPDGKLSILDGQHRVGMMAILEEKKAQGFDLERVLVEVFPQKESFGAEDIFLEINKAEPVRLVDMPGVARKSDRKVITEAAGRLEEKFPDMFKPSQNCRAPHVNVDNLRDALFASNALKRHSLNSQKTLLAWMLEQNELLKAKFEMEGAKSVSEAALKKAVNHNFFLGLESSWLYN